MKLVYFAWIRERIGIVEEEVALPAGVDDVSKLLVWLKSRGEEFATALEHESAIRVAINQEHVGDRRASIVGAREIALVPPMTGG